MRGNIGDKQRLQHILEAITELEDFVKGVTIQDFSSNRMMQHACVRNFEIIGEASTHLSTEFKDKYNSVKWASVKGFRNVIVHEYFKVDIMVIWQLIQTDLPALKQVVLQALKNLEE